jgi:hypothetical protein
MDKGESFLNLERSSFFFPEIDSVRDKALEPSNLLIPSTSAFLFLLRTHYRSFWFRRKVPSTAGSPPMSASISTT